MGFSTKFRTIKLVAKLAEFGRLSNIASQKNAIIMQSIWLMITTIVVMILLGWSRLGWQNGGPLDNLLFFWPLQKWMQLILGPMWGRSQQSRSWKFVRNWPKGWLTTNAGILIVVPAAMLWQGRSTGGNHVLVSQSLFMESGIFQKINVWRQSRNIKRCDAIPVVSSAGPFALWIRRLQCMLIALHMTNLGLDCTYCRETN